MRNTGVLSSDEALRFSQITNRMITAQKSIPDDATKPIEGQLISGANAFVDLFARLVGSKIGSALANVIPGRGQGIIESAAGVRTVLGGLNIPTSLTQDLLLQAARDPKFFKLLVTRPKTEKEAVVTAKRVRAYLLNAGLGFVSREIDDDTEEFKKGAPPLPRQFDPDFIPDKQSSVNLLKEGFPTTQTATVPQSGVNARLAANVGTVPQAAPNPNQRQQFASLFPNDPISGLINAQQPVRMMREGGGVGTESGFDMGLEGDITAQEQVQGGLDPYGDTGSDYSTDVQKALYNPQGFQKGRKTDYIKKMLSLGLADRVQKDAAGKITGIFSGKSPSYMEQFQMDPLGTTLKAVMPGAGIVDLLAGLINPNREVYTGYNPPNIPTKDNLNNNDNEGIVTLRPRQEFQEAKRMINPMDIYLADPNRYRLFGS
jgi:hypothetical protein